MFRLFCIAFFFILSFATSAQILTPAKITASLSKSDFKVGDQIDVIFKVTIDNNWYVYTVGFDTECGPVPMKVTFLKNSGFEVIDSLKAINDHEKHDQIFDCDVRIFEKQGEFRQRIKILSASAKITGEYAGQVCTTIEGKCIIFDGDFTLAGSGVVVKDNNEPEKKNEPETKQQETPVEPISNFKSFNGPKLDPSILDGKPSIETESFAAHTMCVPDDTNDRYIFSSRQPIATRRHS
jgi:hypothetical protein